jgi:hypothetical protein
MWTIQTPWFDVASLVSNCTPAFRRGRSSRAGMRRNASCLAPGASRNPLLRTDGFAGFGAIRAFLKPRSCVPEPRDSGTNGYPELSASAALEPDWS